MRSKEDSAFFDWFSAMAGVVAEVGDTEFPVFSVFFDKSKKVCVYGIEFSMCLAFVACDAAFVGMSSCERYCAAVAFLVCQISGVPTYDYCHKHRGFLRNHE